MFVADVAAGKAYLTQERRLSDDMCPPPGYDSVVGEVRGPKRKRFDSLARFRICTSNRQLLSAVGVSRETRTT